MMNWGHKIIAVFVVFVSLVLFAVYTATNHPTDLVAEDYYNQELKYQNRIDKLNRVASNDYHITVEQTNDFIEFIFPEELDLNVVAGTITFFRPSDENKDREASIVLDSNGIMRFSKSQLFKGKYKILIEWEMMNKEFFQESEIYI